MDDAAIRARLIVRAGGLLLASFTLPYVASGIRYLVRNLGSEPSINSSLYFYFLPIDWRSLAQWFVSDGVPTLIFLAGLVMVFRGSRILERRLTRELARP